MQSAGIKWTRFTKRVLYLVSLSVALLLVFLDARHFPAVEAADFAVANETATLTSSNAQGDDSTSCATCHDQIAQGFAATVHGKVRRTPALRCESCHGDGAEHIEGGGDVTKIKNLAKLSSAEINQTCSQCHSQIKEHVFWRGSKHESAGLSCLNCHSVHHSAVGQSVENRLFGNPETNTKLLRMRNEAETCYQCHADIRKAQYQRSTHLFRNEDREHRLNCSSCHEPHGSIGEKLMRTASLNETCYQCHSEKRGPYLWEHAPVRESCATCHKAHGSNNTALLKTRAPMLCQQCHIQGRHQTVAAKSNSAWALNRSCVNCHQQIHGSNHPSGINLQR